MDSRLLLGFAAVVAAFWAFRSWRRAILVAMWLLVIEGALRKWVLPGAQDIVYFAKDVLLLAAYLGFLRDREQVRDLLVISRPLAALLLAAAGFGLVQVFNPALPNLAVGLFGFKAYFLYVPLVFILPAVFETRNDLARFLYPYALLAIPVGLLASLQFASPAASTLNTYAWDADTSQIVTFGMSSRVRVTATFSFITGYVSFLFASLLLLLSLLTVVGWRFKGNFLLYGALAMTFLGMLLSGSRWPIFMLIGLMPIYLALLLFRERGGAAFARLTLAGAVLVALIAYGASDLVSTYYDRFSGNSDVAGRMVSPLTSPLQMANRAGLAGYGIGATHQAAPNLAPGVPPYSWLDGLILEEESSRVMVELGILGFLLTYGFRILLLFLALDQTRRARDPLARSIAIASLLFFIAHLPSGMVFNVTANLYFWFFAGLLLLSRRLDRQEAPVPRPSPARASSALPRDRWVSPAT
jgi:hypothetical protein